MSADDIARTRQEKDKFFKNSPQSPLTPKQQAAFDGLDYFPYDPTLDLEVTVERFDPGDDITMQTTSGEVQQFMRYGRFSFVVDGKEAHLTIFKAPYGFFLPFVDGNAGTVTYPAGRYLDPPQLDENRFRVDFNAAYNPFCAYNNRWVCPITPPENRLKVAVRAGEKSPTGVWIEME